MKLIAYILIAANIVFAAFYFSTKTDAKNKTVKSTQATLSNLAYSPQSTTQQKPTTASIKPIEAAKPAIQAQPVKPATFCIEISQIIEPETVTSIQSILNKNQITHSVRELESLIKTEYWILIGPFSSTNRTKLEVSNLKKESIDYYIRANEPYTGAISLGLYSGLSNAKGEVERINKKGFDSRLEERKIFKTLYFFDLPSHSSTKLDNNVWNELLKSSSTIKKSKKDC
ncbi:hypothetical protein [Marinicellulosiphila megalodicopiae]|uniref:hypothetical protein n=1 Tax=Marinicellulosiphila megalodicopiae TaxID=2724896 RepID=UPI003BB160D7